LIFRSIIDIIILVLVRLGSFINLFKQNILGLLLLSIIHLILQRLLWALIWTWLGLWLLFTFSQSSFAQVSFICLCVLYSLTLRNLHLSLTQLENSIRLRDWSRTCSTSPFLLNVLVFLGNFTSHCIHMAWMSLLLLLLLEIVQLINIVDIKSSCFFINNVKLYLLFQIVNLFRLLLWRIWIILLNTSNIWWITNMLDIHTHHLIAI